MAHDSPLLYNNNSDDYLSGAHGVPFFLLTFHTQNITNTPWRPELTRRIRRQPGLTAIRASHLKHLSTGRESVSVESSLLNVIYEWEVMCKTVLIMFGISVIFAIVIVAAAFADDYFRKN